MRIFLIIDETCFYQPDFVAELIRNSEYDFIGAALVVKVPKRNNIERYIITHWYYLKTIEILKLFCKKLLFMVFDVFKRKTINGRFYSVQSVFEFFSVDYFKVKDDINSDLYLKKIREKEPDLIISSNSLIFKEQLLNIPKLCINRHSSLLPAYGGLWPVFQALKNSEEKVGVTVHTMERKIDRGIIIFQKEIPVTPGDTVDSLYKKCFSCSASITINAIKIISEHTFDVPQWESNENSSYCSFPTKIDWQKFRGCGRNFI